MLANVIISGLKCTANAMDRTGNIRMQALSATESEMLTVQMPFARGAQSKTLGIEEKAIVQHWATESEMVKCWWCKFHSHGAFSTNTIYPPLGKH